MTIFSRLKSFARRRWKLLVTLGVIFAVSLGPYLVSRMRSRGRRIRIAEVTGANGVTPDDKVETLTVFAYNIAHGRGPIDDNWQEGGDAKRARIARIAKLIAAEKPDVVVLNEVDFNAIWSGGQNQAEAIARSAGFRYRVEQRNLDFRIAHGHWKFGNAILSRYPIVATELIDYPPVAGWEDWLAGRKRGVLCTLRLSKTQQVQIVAVHLETRDVVTRVRSARMLLDLRKRSRLPMILAGDFNASPPGFPFSERAPAEFSNANTMEILSLGRFRRQPADKPTDADCTYPSKAPDRVIDWILIPDDWRFEKFRVLSSQLSDHRPVVATVRINPAPAAH